MFQGVEQCAYADVQSSRQSHSRIVCLVLSPRFYKTPLLRTLSSLSDETHEVVLRLRALLPFPAVEPSRCHDQKASEDRDRYLGPSPEGERIPSDSRS